MQQSKRPLAEKGLRVGIVNINVMKRIFHFLLLIGTLLYTIEPGYAQTPDLSFSIKLNKTKYKKGEPVNCTMTLKNTSQKDMVINNRFLVNHPMGTREISFQIIGPDLQQVPFVVKINAGIKSRKFRALHPGQSDSHDIELSYYFDMETPGKYSVVGYYENTDDSPDSMHLTPAWKGQLVSNKLIINLL